MRRAQVRAGTGGDEAALFAMDLWRMYQRHAGAQGWRWEQLSLLETEVHVHMVLGFEYVGRAYCCRNGTCPTRISRAITAITAQGRPSGVVALRRMHVESGLCG